MSKSYLDEGQTTRRQVLTRLQKCRKDLHVVYQWGLTSLNELSDVIDESMADELFFMIRGKMSRILSECSSFEEAAEEIERNMSQINTSQQQQQQAVHHDNEQNGGEH